MVDPVADAGLTIRAGERRDLPALTELYNHYIEHSVATFDVAPYIVEERIEWFEHYRLTGPHRLLVGERDGELAGYVSSGTFRPKAAYGRSVETSVYLHPDAGGRGDGRRLYEALFAVLDDEPVHRAYAGISLPNEASVRLHERLGFVSIGVFGEVGFKFGRYVDVEWFQRPMPLR
jgi:phosphinothricin acetyltransferase